MKIRLVDIAARAGVSEATVSRVLNQKPVAEPTRERVLVAIDVLGYERPARLRRKSTGLVGLIVPELTNPVFPLMAQFIETSLAGFGYTPLLCTWAPGGMHEDEYVELLREHGASGIIFVSGIHAVSETDPERYARLIRAGTPIVLVNGPLPGLDAPSVSQDDALAVRQALSHVRQLGHTHVGLAVGPVRYTTASRRIAAFERAVAEDDKLEGVIECSQYTVEGGASAAHALLDAGVTAVLCGSDLMAVGAIRAARERGMRVPEDVSVIGSDDGLLAEFADPPLTSVRQNVAGIADAAVRALMDDISGTPSSRRELVFATELVVRRSSAMAPQVRRAIADASA